MIVKKVKYTDTDKPKVWQIGDLVDYIRAPHNTNAHEKIAHAGSRNFLSGTHTGQKLEMILLAEESVHSKMPVSHWIFSWKENEQPSRSQVDELVDIFLAHMGLSDHQAVYGLHYNTKNYHVHIAVNRMHHGTLKVVQPFRGFDIEEAHKVVALVEKKQGWASEDYTRYVVLEDGELARNRVEKPVQPRQEAIAFERATGEKSAQRIAQERGHDIIKNATSWQELHQQLAVKGLRFEKKGSGAILFVGDIAVKASSVDRNFGMSKLCKRLGDFVPAETAPPLEKLQPEPVSTVNLEEWRSYHAECLAAQEDVQEEEHGAAQADEHSIRHDALTARHREERQRVLPRVAKHGLPMLNIARHFLKVQQQEEVRQLRRECPRKRPQKRKGKPQFETWLRRKGMHVQADRWRYRYRLEQSRLPVQTVLEPPVITAPIPPSGAEAQHLERYLAAVSADRVRVTCIRMKPEGGKKTFILDKRGGATNGFTPEEITARLPEMLRLQQRGENIYYTPLSEKRHHILIDDMTRESVEKLYADGFRPAIVQESSPGNYQCVLTVPKLQSPHNHNVGNRLTEQLNKDYGDPKLSGCIHPHRAPGFGNLKPKHRREDGTFPQVKMLHAEKKECAKALQLSRRIEAGYAEAARAQRERAAQLRPPPPVTGRPGDTTAAYFAHYENIRLHLNMEDLSRVDAMIAVRLRASGHSPQAVATALIQCAPTIRQGGEKREGRNWQRYSERTADYAFGVAGDVALAKNERYLEHWRKIEGDSGVRWNTPGTRMQ